ncbi:hypothetical protein LMG33818_001968 [Halomonadaceae bacterium LMG 33818]|uniref:hypothetical protein n=1 Tax=Cernens ardua TaxID=3402176 RepID=UPI003EDBF17E
MRFLMLMMSAVLIAGCSSGGGVSGGSCSKSQWTRQTCAGTDSQCIQRQMDQIKHYEDCHRR